MEYQTRQWLEEALFDLLATKKSLQNISIAELSEHAQIARRTFYRYYHSKDEVLTNYLDRLIQYYIIELQTAKLTNFEDLVNLFFQYWSQYTEPLKFCKTQTYSCLSCKGLTISFLLLIPLSWHLGTSQIVIKDKSTMILDSLPAVSTIFLMNG